MAEKKLHNQKRVGGGKENLGVSESTASAGVSVEDLERSIRLAAQMEEKMRAVQLQNEKLQAKLAQYEAEHQNQNACSREQMRFMAGDMNSNSEI